MQQAGGLKKKRRAHEIMSESVAYDDGMHFGPRSAEGWVELEGDSSVVQSGCYVTLL